MVEADAASHRPSTVASRKSTMSRNSQLVKKATGPMELRPSDILIDRFVGWKTITKNLIAYFEGIADIEKNTANELTKLGGVIQVPFRQGNQFLGEGGMQDIFYGIREKSRSIADHHANLSKTVDGSIVQHLQRLRAEIKAHIKNIQMDTGRLANQVAKERELSTKQITDLARSITLLKNTPMGIGAKEDPWYTNNLVARQLQKQVHEENALQKSIIIMQNNSAHFEEGVVKAIQTAWETFDNWSSRCQSQVQETWAVMGQLMKTIQPNTEWIAFAARSDHLLDPDTPLRNPDHILYPGKDDPSVIPVHMGMLERKKRFTKSYKDAYYILTPAGYLHEYRTSDLDSNPNPDTSFFLPECTLGAPTSANARSHKFHIEGGKGMSGNKRSGFQSMSTGREHSYTFRARSHEEMMEWWSDLRQLSKVYLTSSEPMDRSGPVPAAVRAAGYLSEDEEEGGSSLEEDEEEEEEEDEEESDEEEEAEGLEAETAPAGESVKATEAAEAQGITTDAAPGYETPFANSGIAIGENGYAVEKKEGEAAKAAEGAAEPSSTGEAASLETPSYPDGAKASESGPSADSQGGDSGAPAGTGLLGRFRELL
ncbi:uncharacterized protein L969DRAFT_92403 [Mixia osmundae IAM 14324]|nr:uncharacterized protein L969DRAFT_92403 [Mixia osmundae IAM 14324]KEI41170.1 hypothetical protein L969DRAFT_92403 [Mixia osmundae IAM 14324]